MSGLDRQSFGSCRINFTGFLVSNIKHANTENKSHTHTATHGLTIQMWATVETALWKLSPTWAIKREAGWWDAVSLDCACLWNSAWFALCYHESVSVILQTSTVRRKGQFLSHLWKKTLSVCRCRGLSTKPNKDETLAAARGYCCMEWWSCNTAMMQSRFQNGDIPTAKARVSRKGCKLRTFSRFVMPHEHIRFLKMGEVRERVCSARKIKGKLIWEQLWSLLHLVIFSWHTLTWCRTFRKMITACLSSR